MAILTIPGQFSGKNYTVNIPGETPSVDEQNKIDAFVRQRESDFLAEYEQVYGKPLDTGEGSGFGNYLGEIPKGLARGAVGMLETGALGAAALLPERFEDPTREFIRGTAYNLKPQTDIGLEDSLVGKLSEGVGSFAGILAAGAINPAAAVALAGAAGSGEASERARAKDATEEERTLAAALGLVPGMFDYIPVARIFNRLGATRTRGLKASLGRILQQSGEEALQEAAQEVAQNLIAQGVYDPEQDALDGVGESAALGGGVGAIVQGLVELALPGKRRGAATGTGAGGTAGAGTGAGDTAGAGTEAGESADAEPFDDADMLFPPGMEMRPAITGGAFAALTQQQQAQETAFAQAEKFVVQKQILADAANGMSTGESAQKRKDLLKGLTTGVTDASEQGKLRNAFVQQVRNRIGVPVVRPEPEFSADDQLKLDKWRASTKAFLDAGKKAGPEMVPTPVSGTQLTAKQKKAAEAAARKAAKEAAAGVVPPVATAPVLASADAGPPAATADLFAPAAAEPVVTPAAAPVIASADAVAAAPVGAPVVATPPAGKTLFTPEFVQSLGFSERSPTTKAATAPAGVLAGKPLSDPAVQERLNTLLANNLVPPAIKDAIRAAMAPAPSAAPVLDPAPTAAGSVPDLQVLRENASEVFGEGSERVRYTDPSTQGTLELVSRPNGEASVLELEVPEQFRGQGVGQRLQARALQDFPKMGGQVSSKAAAATAYRLGRRPQGQPDATLEDVFGIIDDMSSVNLVSAKMQRGPAPKPTASVAETPAPTASVAEREPMRGAIPGEVSGTAGQNIAQGVRGVASSPAPSVVTPTAAANPNDGKALGEQIAAYVRSTLPQEQQDFLYAGGAGFIGVDSTDATDKSLILALLAQGGAKTPEEKAAKKFFSKFNNPTEALEEIAAQSVLSPKTFDKRGDSAEASAFYAGMGSDAAVLAGKWALTRVSAPARAAFRKARQDARSAKARLYVQSTAGQDPVTTPLTAVNTEAPTAEEKAAGEAAFAAPITPEERAGWATGVAEAAEATKAEQNLLRAERAAALARRDAEPAAIKRAGLALLRAQREAAMTPEERNARAQRDMAKRAAVSAEQDLENAVDIIMRTRATLALKASAVTGLDQPLLPSVRRLLAKGDLKRALEAIAATAESSGVARAARAFSRVSGTTKVELVTDLTAEDGSPASGRFDPATNTISLDVSTGLNFHTVLHEMTHATVSKTIANPSHPLTMQLKTLFTNTKPALGAAYGTTSLQEFAAEVMGSVKFRQSLAQLNERGKTISALDRAMHAISNFVRRLMGMNHRTMDSALSRGDQIVMGMLAPAPESRNSGALYMASRKGTAGRVLDNLLNAGTVEPTAERMNKLTEVLTDAGSNAKYGINNLFREAVLRLTPLHYLVQIAAPYFPSAPRLNELVNEANGEMARVLERTSALNNAIGKWASGNRELVDRFNSLINYSTLYQVDPEISGAAALKAYGSDTDRMQQYRAVMADWNAVNPSGQAEYRRLRNVFRTLQSDLMSALDARLEAAIPDAQVRARVRKDLYTQLTKKDQLSVYFALGRDGDYWMTYNAYDPRSGSVEYFVEAFKSQADRNRAQLELQSDPDTQAGNFNHMLRTDSEGFANAPPASFIAKLNTQLRGASVDENTIRLVTNLYLDTVPETSFLQSYRQRKGTLGFNKDAIRTNTSKANSLARNIVQLRFGSKFSALKTKFEEEAKQLGSETAEVRQIRNQLNAFANFASNPALPGWSQTLRSLAFNMTLGFNISTAMLNLMQMPMIGLPFLGAKYGYRETTRAMGAAARMIAGSGTMREIDVYNPDGTGLVKERVEAQPSLENYDFTAPNLSPELQKLQYLVAEGRTNGQFNRSVTLDTLDIDGSQGLSEKFNRATGWMLHHSERYNREVALASSYMLELGRLEKAGTALTPEVMRNAAKQAVYLTEMINGGTAAASTPRIAQNGLGSVAFMYKRYGVSMYALMFDSAKRALKDQSPEARRIAQKQIGGLVGATALLSGIAGLPMFGTAAMLYNLLWADDDEEQFESVVREYIGDGANRGILDYALGISVAPRIGLSDILFREPMIEKEQSSLWTVAEVLGGPAIGTYLNLERGIKDMADGQWQRGIESASPAAIRYFLKAGRFGTEGALTRSGDSIVEDIHPGHVLAQALGFAPAELIGTQAVSSARKKFTLGIDKRKSKLADRYAMAQKEGNSEAMKDVIEDIRAFNADHPSVGIDRDFLRSSTKSRANTDKRTYNGVSFDARLVDEVRTRFKDYQG
jgi:predicted GNAT family acetyltransferase